MLYVRGHRWDYDHWASLGNAGWSYDEVLPYFKRAEIRSRTARTLITAPVGRLTSPIRAVPAG